MDRHRIITQLREDYPEAPDEVLEGAADIAVESIGKPAEIRREVAVRCTRYLLDNGAGVYLTTGDIDGQDDSVERMIQRLDEVG